MYSTSEQLRKRTGRNKVDRPKYLQLLCEEYKTTTSQAAKEQVLANLANFAYDPINYQYIKQLSVIDIFLGELENINGDLVEFALAGICNLASDADNQEYIVRSGGVPAIIKCLAADNIEIVLSAITSLIFLISPTSKSEIINPEVIQYMNEFSRNPNVRIKNLATVFLQHYCDQKPSLNR